MAILPLRRLGVHETEPGVLTFGALFPGVRPPARVIVRILHHAEQFLQASVPYAFDLEHQDKLPETDYPDYWTKTINMKASKLRKPGSRWGRDGRYVYRYYIRREQGEPIDFVSDPFGREFGVGAMSAFTMGYRPYEWDDAESEWKTPHVRDLVIYELMLAEFAGNLQGATRQLPYLADLGVNCVEIMPVSNAARSVDWGFLPTGYFGVDDRFGTRTDMHRFIEAAHREQIAVILDSVYGHTDSRFPYQYLYHRLGIESPVMGTQTRWGSGTDWKKAFTRDFFETVNYFWLDRFHVDGFRYDCVPDYFDGKEGVGYAHLVRRTYELAQEQHEHPHWDRFRGSDGKFHLIQCAEYLDDPRHMLWETFSNCCWQNETLGVAHELVHNPGKAETFGEKLSMDRYPDKIDAMPKAALQYIENHDHPRFICQITGVPPHDLFAAGDRRQWFKLRPYLIALLTSKGVPLLWQGEELCESYSLPPEGVGRPWHLRPVRWSYAYDEPGRATLTLVRKLLAIRRDREEMRRGSYNVVRGQPAGVLICERVLDDATSVVMLNFTDHPVTVSYQFPHVGTWCDLLGTQVIEVAIDQQTEVVIAEHNGHIWVQ